MQTKVVSTLAELRASIAAMPPPPAGRVRVFRGQTREYANAQGEPSLLPALSRRSGSTYDPAWLGTMMEFVRRGAKSDDLTAFHAWGPALVQHYGPGSHFLDVSHDLDVALWFASHEYRERWLMLSAGGHDRQVALAWSTDVSVASSPVLYAFDARPWDGQTLLEHGQLVDLLALESKHGLAARATRLRVQAAALIYSDPRSDDGPDLGPKVALRLKLDSAFDLAEIADLKWVEDIYPHPPDDPLYKALIEFPAQMRFDPIRLEQPLTIPFQLTRPLPFEGSPNVLDLGGAGDYASPKRVKFNGQAGPDLHAVNQVLDYLGIGRHLDPALFHAWLMQNSTDEIDLAGEAFRLRDALPLCLEAPLWTFLPSVSPPRQLGQWIQSALPLGIADEIDGRSTRNVYIEVCPLDVLQIGEKLGEDLLRGIWLARSGDDYAITLFRKGPEEIYSFRVRYRYDAESGSFQRLGKAVSGKLAEPLDWSLKALFLTLTVLRDLSPGFKPAPFYNFVIDGERYIPEPLLVPKLAEPHRASAGPYVIPKALDGTRYLHAIGGSRNMPTIPADPGEALNVLERFFPLVKAKHYRAFAGARLANLQGAAGRLDAALETADAALSDARAAGVMVENLEELKKRIQQATESLKGDRDVKNS